MHDNTVAIFDTKLGLSYVANNTGLYQKLLNRFLNDHADEAQKIQQSLQVDDLATARRLAHTMKSLTATLGGLRLSAVAKDLELALSNDTAPSQETLDNLTTLFTAHLQDFLQAVTEYMQNNGVQAPALPVQKPTQQPAYQPIQSASSIANLAEPFCIEQATKHFNSSLQTILMVDDSPEQLEVLKSILGTNHNIYAFSSGNEALACLDELKAGNKFLPDLILLDVLMPDLDGYATYERMKKLPQCRDIPAMFLTGLSETSNEAKGLALGAVDYITKPFQPELLKSRIERQLELKHIRDNLEKLVEERTYEIQLTQKVTIETLANLAEYRSLETGNHIKRTQKYVDIIAKTMSKKPQFANILTPALLYDIEMSAPLHDIGKVGISDAILCKPGKLTDEEFEEMKKHTTYGHEALSLAIKTLGKKSFLTVASLIAIGHHEKWDGSGYPNKLKGEEIPLVARIMALADVYDALTTQRVYKPAFTHEQARNIIVESRGTHFDPQVVDTFLEQEQAFKDVLNELD